LQRFDGLQDLGWVPGTNLQLDARFGANDDDLREKAQGIVGLAPDVILAMAPPSIIALLKTTRTIPIVFAAVTDPVGFGIVRSLAHPGGNATGFLTAELARRAKVQRLK
jgi:putative tryptophan/tyrosine transport system substrate-binding protein